jgi:class 3 adenylate cyclase/tetratricopeptide (TPR) repeat protein
MTACPSCGHENAETNKFCAECGAPLGAPARPVAEERKVVTSLFCDLVGFTATSESADPEDVDRMLAAYFALARAQIEAHGGVVEKFIGDAVVGVFGVPAAHEDDPERAVRAGLRIVEDAEELLAVGGAPLRLRVGINTGEALVRRGVTPGSGEGFLAGDAINTASRLQSAAPEMGVAVGVSTYEATAAVFDYEELPPATLKGKSEPVRIFHAKAPRARVGTDITRTHDTPFIGREIDLALLKGIFDKTVAAEAVQLVTVVGEPGLGKSRIVAELGGYVDARPELITWRQGRCLPYGEGITFWALGEIVKAHAGILESDPSDVASGKLDALLLEGPEREWFRQRLLPLLGIEATSSAEREELFTAWRRFLEQIAEGSPTVLVFEDLHWADEAMLGFLEYLADRAEGVPLLVIGTARPELYERRTDYAAGLRNANTINLSPLSSEETARLVSALLQTTVLPAELQQPILERAGGNPLYAEEFVRLLKDRDLLVKKGSSWELREGAEVPFPDSVQALIAARLDTLSADTKSMLADAAVVGKVFWAGAVAQMGERDPTEVTETLRELSRKELVRPVRRSSMQGEVEYGFWHVLARDVAYAQLPRAARASRHIAAARWIESKATARVEDLAEVLAYHYATASELAAAAGQSELVAQLEAPTLRFLTLSGERALGLDTAAAVTSFDRALTLTPRGHPQRAEVLSRFGQAALDAGRLVQAAEALEEAIAAFRKLGDLPAAARAMFTLVQVMSSLGDPRTFEIGAEALSLLEPVPPGPELVGALIEVARAGTLGGEPEQGVSFAERALALAVELGLPLPARALGYKGLARAELGDQGGLTDMRQALHIAIEAGQGREAGTLYNNLGRTTWPFEGPAAALEVYRQGVVFNEARGLASLAIWIGASLLDALADSGELDEVLATAGRLAERAEIVGVLPSLLTVRSVQARVLALRGEAELAAPFLDWLEDSSRDTGAPEEMVLGLASAAIARTALGHADRAAELLNELAATPQLGAVRGSFPAWVCPMVRAALQLGDRALAERIAGSVEPIIPYAEHAVVAARAALAEADQDFQAGAESYADAADRWERFGVVAERAFALLGQGRCLVGLARPNEAVTVLRRAREIFERLQAAPALAEIDALLQEATALSS